MTIQEFAEHLQNELKKMHQKEKSIHVVEQSENNGIKKMCLLVKKPGQEEVQITGIERYYQSLLSGDKLEDIVEDISIVIQVISFARTYNTIMLVFYLYL